MPLLVLGFFLLLEAVFRLHYFGPSAILLPWRYTPFELARMGLTRPVPNRQIKRGIRPNVHALFKGKPFSTNSAGFRDREFALHKAPGVVRIAVLGTSIDMGSGVADEEVYNRRLQAKLDAAEPGRFEVLNFAMSGSSFAQIVAIYDAFVAQYEPDAVIAPLLARGRYPRRSDKPARGREPLLVRPMLGSFFTYGAMRRAANDWTKGWFARDWVQRGTSRPASRPDLLAVLAPFFRARAREGVAVFLLTPPTVKDSPRRDVDPVVDEAREWTREFDNVHIIDVRQHLAETTNGSDHAFYGDLHPNAHVHEEVAVAIFEQWDTIEANLQSSRRLAELHEKP